MAHGDMIDIHGQKLLALVPRATEWSGMAFPEKRQIGISVTVKTSAGPHRFAVRLYEDPSDEDIAAAAATLNARIGQYALPE